MSNLLLYILIPIALIPFLFCNKKTLQIFGVSLLLFVIAVILFCLLTPLGLLWVVCIIIALVVAANNTNTVKHICNQFILYLSQILFSFGFSLDNMGCVILGPFLNRYFIKSTKYSFGSVKHTISLVIAYCYIEGTLLKPGKVLYDILEYADPGHSSRAIFDYETKIFNPNRYTF